MHKHCFTETETQLNALELYVSVPWSFFFFLGRIKFEYCDELPLVEWNSERETFADVARSI